MTFASANEASIRLSPTQQKAFDQIQDWWPQQSIISLVTNTGVGRTTILKKFAKSVDAKFLSLADVFDYLPQWHPFQVEEAVGQCLYEAFLKYDAVVFDDWHFLLEVFEFGCESARPIMWKVMLDATLKNIVTKGKKLLLGMDDKWVGDPLHAHCMYVALEKLTPEDFAFIFQSIGGEKMTKYDYTQIHSFAPRLSGHKIKIVCQYLAQVKDEEVDDLLSFLEKHAFVSNVRQEEVESYRLEDLLGAESVIKQLEIDVITPLERPDLVEKVGIQPKRGVLLYGPPGTGKTTIGRALAHRLRSKFFLLDGTVISGTQNFYSIIHSIFKKAKENAPSIIFIDDCDVLFEEEDDTGLYRYLLTMMDGLESKGNSKVTLILTAMNIGSLPPALIRSGRVELWLEMKLPHEKARAGMIHKLMEGFGLEITSDQLNDIINKTDGLTGADLKRLVADARNLHGYDLATEAATKTAFEYLIDALEQLKRFREQLDSAPAQTAAHKPIGRQKFQIKGF